MLEGGFVLEFRVADDDASDGAEGLVGATQRSGIDVVVDAFRLEGVPLPDNPRSSMLTAYSVARALLNIHAAVPM